MVKGILPLKGFLYSFHSINILVLSFLPLLLFHNGFTETQIGLILSIGPAASLIAEPLSGYLSDLWKTNKKVILAYLCGLILSGMLLFQVHSFFLILSIYFVLIFFLSPVSAMADSLSQKTANQMNMSFGSIRLWGSAGFAVTALIAGQWFARLGIDQLPWLFLFFSLLTTVLGLFLQDVSVSERKVSNRDFMALLKNQRFLRFLVVVFFVTITQRCNDNFIGLHLKQLGASDSVIGWAWFIGVMTEVIVFATAHIWFKRLDELTFIALAAVLYTIRFFITAQLHNPLAVLWIQPLHGVTFGIFFPAAFQYVTKIVKPEIQSTGHILMITVLFGVSGMIGSLLGGMVMKGYGGFMLYDLLGASSFIGLLAVLGYQRLYRG